MKGSVFERWANSLVQKGIVSREDEELYSYGLRQSWLFLLNVSTALVIGWLMDALTACILFMVCYVPLRRMAGGYHARTPFRCYLLGIVLITAALAAIKWLPWTMKGALITAAIASVVIWRLAPVEDENKPLDEEEREMFQKRARQIVIIELLVFMTNIILQKDTRLGVCIAMAMLTVCSMLCYAMVSSKVILLNK